MSDNDRPAWAYAAENLPAARAAGIDPPDDDDCPRCGEYADDGHTCPTEWTDSAGVTHALTYPDDDTLGPCGCTDYHLADCPIRTGGVGMTSADAWAWAERRARREDDGWADE